MSLTLINGAAALTRRSSIRIIQLQVHRILHLQSHESSGILPSSMFMVEYSVNGIHSAGLPGNLLGFQPSVTVSYDSSSPGPLEAYYERVHSDSSTEVAQLSKSCMSRAKRDVAPVIPTQKAVACVHQGCGKLSQQMRRRQVCLLDER
jgi:hypothetical protein